MSHSFARRVVGCALAVACLGLVVTGEAQQTNIAGPQWRGAETNVVAREGTNFAATAAPGRDRVVIDLQGVLWSVPFGGGDATRLTDDFFEAVRPHWSPDGARIVLSTFHGGMSHVWSIAADGGDRQQLTHGAFDDFEPRWSPDGKAIAFASDRSGSREIWIYRVASKSLRQMTGVQPTAANDGAPAPDAKSEPAWSADGRNIAYVVGGTRVDAVNIESGATRTLLSGGTERIFAPSWSPDGSRLAFVRNRRLMVVGLTAAESAARAARPVSDFDDVFPYHAEWLSDDELLYTANGRIQRSRLDGDSREIPFAATLTIRRSAYRRKSYDFDSVAPRTVQGIAGPAISPDGRSIVFKALNDLWLLTVGGKARKLTDDSFYEIDPAWSRDGKLLAYASDKSGTTDIHVRDMQSGVERRITGSNGAEVAAAWSPDGARLAFLEERPEPGGLFVRDLCVVDVATGKVDRLARNLSAPGRPSWSADGQWLAFATSQGSRNRIGIVNVASRQMRLHDPSPDRSISTRGDDGPVWSPDGRQLAFSMGSTLWVLPVQADGAPAGEARQLTTHASDAPSWTGDSRQLLYLYNGQLRLLDIQRGTGRDIAHHLSYKQDVARHRTVIHVGRLWDGVTAEPRENVDITVVDNRIASIDPHDAKRAKRRGVRFVDASELTATPGLFDMHYHQQVSMKSYGDRAGRLALAYGVTSTRSTGDPVYRAVEDRESLSSGARIGPRYFMTGEMLDGPRLDWDFARPVESEAQLALELSRAQALSYDVMKTYMRFGFDWQARVTSWAHQDLGVSVTSHYLYPGVAHGVDGQEHLGGPTRWGGPFSHMRGKRYYQDVLDLITKSGIQETTSIFAGAALIANDPTVYDDVRARTLLTAADLAGLRGKAACIEGKGPCGFLGPNRAAAQNAAEEFARLVRAGAVILIGTDAPLDTPALSVHSNLRTLALSLPPFQVLQTATINAARAQGVEQDLGSIEVGKLADLVFVGGDPARDIDDLIDVRHVMKAGRLYSIAELLAPFAEHTAPPK